MSESVTERLQRRARFARGGNVQVRYDNLMPWGSPARKGKWRNLKTLRSYRKRRDQARRIASESRMRNWQ